MAIPGREGGGEVAMNGRSSMLARRLAVAAGGIAVGLWGRRALRALEYLSSSEPFGGKDEWRAWQSVRR